MLGVEQETDDVRWRVIREVPLGLGVALINPSAAEAGCGKLVGRKLRPAPSPVRVAVGLPAHREVDPVLAAFVEEVCQARG